jgi:hypothetical protein
MTSRIRLVFAKGSSVVKVPSVSEERVGPVLAAALTACAPGDDGIHCVPVKEIPSAALGAPLKHFFANGKLSKKIPPLLLAPSYKVAERLDIIKMVRCVERVAMAAVASGDVRLKDVAQAFSGCPRIAALCDNYLCLPGARLPPPHNLVSKLPKMAAEYGALMVVCNRTYPGETMDEVRLVVDARRCEALSSTNAVCKDVCAILERTGSQPPPGCLAIIWLPYPYKSVVPCDPSTWLPLWGNNYIQPCHPSNLQALLKNGSASSYVSLIACSDGDLVYSSDKGMDLMHCKGLDL